MKIYFLFFLLFLVACTPPIEISLNQLKSGNYTGQKVTIQASFFDNYNAEYKQFADDSTYIYVKAKGNFSSRRYYTLTGKVENCTIKENKIRYCLIPEKIT